MLRTEYLPYKIERYERIAETAGPRASILTLASGDEVPWHKHNHVNDQFFCMDGAMCIETRMPASATTLEKGDTLKIPSGQPHRVMGLKGEACRFLIIQGDGEYDFVPE